jgi:hypothetical protein
MTMTIFDVTECDEMMNRWKWCEKERILSMMMWWQWFRTSLTSGTWPNEEVLLGTIHTPFSLWTKNFEFEKRVRDMVQEFLRTQVKTWNKWLPSPRSVSHEWLWLVSLTRSRKSRKTWTSFLCIVYFFGDFCVLYIFLRVYLSYVCVWEVIETIILIIQISLVIRVTMRVV